MCRIFKAVLFQPRFFLMLFLAMAFMVVLPVTVQAGGGREITTHVADGIDIWQTEFDVSDKKPGTYNILINARDAAGNEGVSGPFNIKIDPMAGLPEARIVYPEHGQVIREDINIVGVAAGRYGLKEILVKINDEEYYSLEGNAYWSYYIPAMDLPEGRHTITVKAIDSHDLTGPEMKIEFILDLEPPEVELIDREIGDLIAGSVKIKGKVSDANGIHSLALSTDGVKFSNLRLSKKRGDDSRYFQFPIRSKKYDDGPLVYFIRATNKTGNSITRPYLFFVNNFAPQIEILSPKLGEDTYGITQVVGRVHSGVGLTEFYYEWANERHDIPLHIGDPFWTVSFPISMANNRAIPFRVTAVDKSGNVTVVTQRFQDTRRNRTPTMMVDYPPQPAGLGRMNLDLDQPIYGRILPGFFPYAVMIEGEVEYVMAQPVFRIDPEFIPEGRNTMRMWAIDEDDVTGQPFTLRINKPEVPEGYYPDVREYSLTIESPEPYEWFNESVTVRGSLNENIPGRMVQFRMSWDDPWQPIGVNENGAFVMVIDLDTVPEGAVPLEFRTVTNGIGDYPVFFPVNKFTTLPEITFLTPGEQFGAIHGDVTTAGVINNFVPLTQLFYSIDGANFESLDFVAQYDRSWFADRFDYSALHMHNQKLTVRVVDRAGNRVEASPDILFDNSDDIPILILNFPNEDDLITGDFDISGLAFDDDEIAMIYWRILSPWNPWDSAEETINNHGDVEFHRFETKQNFLMNVSLADVTDGENILEIFAQDVFGVSSEVIQRVFRVSTAAPLTLVTEPQMDIWNRGNIVVRGTAYDLNDIRDILISMDNGVSYQRADFTNRQEDLVDWNISLNTKAYSDGIYSMLVRTIDKYGVSSFANGIINIDNTPPEIDLGSPGNGDKVGITLPITGQVYDAIGVTRISTQLVNIDNPNLQRSYDLPPEFVIMEAMDVAAFPDGDYTLKISAYDQAGNETTVIRNVNILKARAASEVALINPLPGILHHGPVVISGRITGAVIPETVTLMLNGEAITSVEVNRYGIFRYDLPEDAIQFTPPQILEDPQDLEELGLSAILAATSEPEASLPVATTVPVIFSAYFATPGGEQIESFENLVMVSNYGPVLIIDSHHDGDVITRRPWISGRAYYVLPEDLLEGEEAAPAGKSSGKSASDRPAVSAVELSFDNGRSFVDARGGEEWKFRLETGELSPGPLPIVVKATFADGSVAVRRIILTVDTRVPSVHTIGPPENSAHRTSVSVYGSAADDFDMDVVEVHLRPGDKAGYAVPGFIQGLYFDGSALGGLNYTLGMGLTFFDDNVKVQFNVAQAGAGSRYSGWAFGGKILANVYKKNLSEWFGPDWEFYTTSLVVGAHFSYFMMEEGETPLWMGQLLGQWEMIKADMSFFFPNWKYFKSISLYTEPGLWFAPSDVVSDQAWRTKFTIAFGGRISLF